MEILKKETLVKLIEHSEGSKTWNSLMARDHGEVVDILRNGELSCAYFVSSLLYFTDLIDRPRATVRSTEFFLQESPLWEKVSTPYQPGDVIVWEKQRFDSGEEHAHIGFIVDSTHAVSTNDKQKCVTKHEMEAGRTISTVYRLIGT